MAVVLYCFCWVGLSGKKMRRHFSKQRWEWSDGSSMCNVKVKDWVPSKELRERLGIDDIILILQQNRLWWYGHVLRKEDTDWVKKCMEYEVEGSRPRGRPKRTWREVVQRDCQARNLKREDAMDRGRWKKLIKNGWWSGWWVGECFFWYWLTRVVPGRRAVKRLLLFVGLEACEWSCVCESSCVVVFACCAPLVSRPSRHSRSRRLLSWIANWELASSRPSTSPARLGRVTDATRSVHHVLGSSPVDVPIGDAICRHRRCSPCVCCGLLCVVDKHIHWWPADTNSTQTA